MSILITLNKYIGDGNHHAQARAHFYELDIAPKPQQATVLLHIITSERQVLFYCVNMLQFILSPIDGVVLERTLPFFVNHKAATNCCVQIYVKMVFFWFASGQHLGENLGHVECVFNV